MPYINLGNLITSSQGISNYTHKYHAGSKTHIFTGMDQLGFCQCSRDWHLNDIIKINDIEITEINYPEKIKAYTWIYFVVEQNKMYIFNKTSSVIEIPDGELVEPINDIVIWCACAGLDWYQLGSPSLETLLSSSHCEQLFLNENAFAYFKRSDKIIASAMSNNYVIEYLEKKDYWTSFYVTGLSNNPEGYYVSTSNACHSDYQACGAFAQAGKVYLTKNEVVGNYQWCQLQIPESILPYKMTIIPSYASYGRVGTVIWQGSVDGTEWIDLDSQQLQSNSSALYTFYNKAGCTKKCSFFRLTLASSPTNQFWAVFGGRVHGFL